MSSSVAGPLEPKMVGGWKKAREGVYKATVKYGDHTFTLTTNEKGFFERRRMFSALKKEKNIFENMQGTDSEAKIEFVKTGSIFGKKAQIRKPSEPIETGVQSAAIKVLKSPGKHILPKEPPPHAPVRTGALAQPLGKAVAESPLSPLSTRPRPPPPSTRPPPPPLESPKPLQSEPSTEESSLPPPPPPPPPSGRAAGKPGEKREGIAELKKGEHQEKLELPEVEDLEKMNEDQIDETFKKVIDSLTGSEKNSLKRAGSTFEGGKKEALILFVRGKRKKASSVSPLPERGKPGAPPSPRAEVAQPTVVSGEAPPPPPPQPSVKSGKATVRPSDEELKGGGARLRKGYMKQLEEREKQANPGLPQKGVGMLEQKKGMVERVREKQAKKEANEPEEKSEFDEP